MNPTQKLFSLLNQFPDHHSLSGASTAALIGGTLKRYGANSSNAPEVENALHQALHGSAFGDNHSFPVGNRTMGAVVKEIAETWSGMSFAEKQAALYPLGRVSSGEIATNALER